MNFQAAGTSDSAISIRATTPLKRCNWAECVAPHVWREDGKRVTMVWSGDTYRPRYLPKVHPSLRLCPGGHPRPTYAYTHPAPYYDTDNMEWTHPPGH